VGPGAIRCCNLVSALSLRAASTGSGAPDSVAVLAILAAKAEGRKCSWDGISGPTNPGLTGFGFGL